VNAILRRKKKNQKKKRKKVISMMSCDVPCVDLENSSLGLLIGHGEFNLAVDSAGTN
jgi:hypothetical protein